MVGMHGEHVEEIGMRGVHGARGVHWHGAWSLALRIVRAAGDEEALGSPSSFLHMGSTMPGVDR